MDHNDLWVVAWGLLFTRTSLISWHEIGNPRPQQHPVLYSPLAKSPWTRPSETPFALSTAINPVPYRTWVPMYSPQNLLRKPLRGLRSMAGHEQFGHSCRVNRDRNEEVWYCQSRWMVREKIVKCGSARPRSPFRSRIEIERHCNAAWIESLSSGWHSW